MAEIELVDLATARAARGVRMVASGVVPSPWTEAAKGLFRVGGVPVRVVHFVREDAEQAAWMRADSVPVVLHDDEPPRTSWAAITALAARLAPGLLLPEDAAGRARVMGLVHELAGEDGVGWITRLVIIHASLASDGARGFPVPISRYLAGRYGYRADDAAGWPVRVAEVLGMFRDQLRAGGGDYLAGAALSAADIYLATFLTPLTAIEAGDCPGLSAVLRRAFATSHEVLGALVPGELLAHRRRMFERHLAWPIRL